MCILNCFQVFEERNLICMEFISYRFYFAFVIGSKGVVRRRLESETKTQIRVPKQGQDGYIGTNSGFN